jgi:hypothetical protein
MGAGQEARTAATSPRSNSRCCSKYVFSVGGAGGFAGAILVCLKMLNIYGNVVLHVLYRI